MEFFDIVLPFPKESFFSSNPNNSFYDDVQPWEKVDAAGFTQPTPPSRENTKRSGIVSD